MMHLEPLIQASRMFQELPDTIVEQGTIEKKDLLGKPVNFFPGICRAFQKHSVVEWALHIQGRWDKQFQ